MSKSLTPIEDTRRTLAAQVQERIREAILKQLLRPAEHIDQNKLADDLQVSMATVREALKGLEAEGLVNIQPRRGAFVVEVSIADMDELYFTRQLIEGEAIYHAVPLMTNADFASLEKMIAAMRQATDADNVNSYIALNRDFHLCIYNAVGNKHLIQVIRTLWDHSELYRYRYMFVTRDHERIHLEHQGILDACRQRDQALARERARQHIHLTQRELDEQLRGDPLTHRQDGDD
jgi:DNA-binding GntR family transcriptional regulator